MVCAAVWIAASPCARAAADGVELRVPDCGEVSGAQITKLVELELRSRESSSLELDGEGGRLRASLSCAGDAAVITVEDPTREAPLVLEMQLAQTRREARPRLLALAIAELIATSRLEQAPAATAREDEEPRNASLEPERSDDESAQGVSLWLAGGLATAYEPRHWAGAFALGAAYSVSRISLGAEVGFDGATETYPQAKVRARAGSVALAPSFILVRGPYEWSVGLGLRASYARLEAAARDATLRAGSVSGLVLEPFVTTALNAPIAGSWFLRLAVQFGYAAKPLRGVDADGRPLMEVRGIRAAALLGLGTRL